MLGSVIRTLGPEMSHQRAVERQQRKTVLVPRCIQESPGLYKRSYETTLVKVLFGAFNICTGRILCDPEPGLGNLIHSIDAKGCAVNYAGTPDKLFWSILANGG